MSPEMTSFISFYAQSYLNNIILLNFNLNHRHMEAITTVWCQSCCAYWWPISKGRLRQSSTQEPTVLMFDKTSYRKVPQNARLCVMTFTSLWKFPGSSTAILPTPTSKPNLRAIGKILTRYIASWRLRVILGQDVCVILKHSPGK